jgi:periplasmic copper chaperone A
MKKLLTLLGGAGALLLLVAGPAGAHVEPSVSQAGAGSFTTFSLHIGHGCDGEGGDTAKVEVQLPDGIDEATPQNISGWDASVANGVVTFEGGRLPHDQYLDFGLSVQMPDTPGETVLFPTIQTCESGEELAWIEETPEGGEEPEHPAPAIEIVEASALEHDHGAAGEERAEEVAAGTTEDDGADGLSVLAFIVGTLGLVAGGYALISTRRAG